MVKLVEHPIDPVVIYNSICLAYSGSVVIHYAVVKKRAGTGKSTTAIEYCAQNDAMQEMESITQEMERRWRLEDVLLVRRAGQIAVGEIISLIAASAPNSEDAFEACRFGISRIRKMSTIHKTEKFANVA
jgi:molybdopterin synthase catalytic subunit